MTPRVVEQVDRLSLTRRIDRRLASAGIANSANEARWIVADVIENSETSLVLDEEQAGRALALAARRCAGEPLQYVLGSATFRYLELAVGPGTLIPRPETEVVVERALLRAPGGGTLVDVGTGSGAIALAAKQERADLSVFATELDPDALVWARANRDALALEVELLQGDLLSVLPPYLRRRVDVVVANLPYVATSDASSLPRDVVEHEPHLALFAGERGLDVIARLVAAAPEWLARDGWLIVEIGFDQAAAARDLMAAAGYRRIATVHDLAGRDRIVEACPPPS